MSGKVNAGGIILEIALQPDGKILATTGGYNFRVARFVDLAALLEPAERGFLYMPFQHSEDLADQRRSLALFTALGDDYLLGYAKKHHAIVERFGRFPHRNAILGRALRADEIAAGKVVPW